LLLGIILGNAFGADLGTERFQILFEELFFGIIPGIAVGTESFQTLF